MRRLTRRMTDDETEHTTKEHKGVQNCPECDSQTLLTSADGSELVCEDCGLIIEERTVDRGPEWRAFNHQERERKSRVGAPITKTMHDKGLTTNIDWKDRDASGHALSAEKRNQMHRLRKWQGRIRTKDAGERNLKFALSEIDRMASALGIPRSIREVACVLYRRALDEDLIRGRSIEGIATSCLYAACRTENIPRSFEEMEEVSRVRRKEITRSYMYLGRELGLEIHPANPKQYVPRFCSALGCSDAVEAKTNELLDIATTEGLLSGKSPTSCAAAAIYAASLLCDEQQTQQAVADVAQVTEVTIRNRYQEQIDALDLN
ncbi:transcription initiation factor IIB [Haladaptatus caseinilyticus]|uniref:transcription initiation factor IIB n=1 Tax=Haladaptatus caseinilyticus TaxID=2993314 RepID=UPI00224AF7E5|nr:transcription initiation factor IIB [Haladaptatus caseinilyticus]